MLAPATRRRFANLMFVLFALAPLGAGSTSCVSCFAQTNLNSITLAHHQFVPSFCPRAWIGQTGLYPGSSDAEHALERTLQAGVSRPFVKLSLDPLTNDYTLNDAKIALNSNANIIVDMDQSAGVTSNNWSNAVATVLAHYGTNLWGISAQNEPPVTPAGVTNYLNWLRPARAAIDAAGYTGRVRVCGPSTANDYVDFFCTNLYTLGVLSNLDVIDAHDYFAVPGGGACTNDGLGYTHPDQTTPQGYPNLDGRLKNMLFYRQLAGSTNPITLGEYALYNGDVNDARMTATIIGTNQPCVVVLFNPGGGGNCPQLHATPAWTWDNTLLEFMNAACSLPAVPTNSGGGVIVTNIIASDRLVKWQGNVGIPAGIPNVTTIYTNIAAGASLSQVNAAISACPSGQVVALSAGTYNFSSDLSLNDKIGVVVRGAGPTNTFVVFSSGGVTMKADRNDANLIGVNLSQDAIKGATTVFTTNVPSWVTPGKLIGIDQTDDPAFSTNSGSNGGNSYRGALGYGARGVSQLDRVVSKTSTSITFEVPMYWGWQTARVAQIFQPHFDPSSGKPVILCGIENLTLTATYTGNDQHMVTMDSADNCWVKNCIITNTAGGAGVFGYFAFRCEVRHCTISDSHTISGGQGYGVEPYDNSSAWLVEDNIFTKCHAAMCADSSSGNVFAYNYERAGQSAAANNQNDSMSAHQTTSFMNLWEGNFCDDKVLADWTHGANAYGTVFRCRITGTNGISAQFADSRTPVSIQYYNRFWNIVGNVLGVPGVQNKYLTDNNSTSMGTTGSIIKVGTDDAGVLDANSYTNGAFILIHGNWDSVQNQVTWSPFVSSHTFTNSYYLSAKPSYFGSLPWPPFDSANPAAASATNIPASYRYFTGHDPS